MSMTSCNNRQDSSPGNSIVLPLDSWDSLRKSEISMTNKNAQLWLVSLIANLSLENCSFSISTLPLHRVEMKLSIANNLILLEAMKVFNFNFVVWIFNCRLVWSKSYFYRLCSLWYNGAMQMCNTVNGRTYLSMNFI